MSEKRHGIVIEAVSPEAVDRFSEAIGHILQSDTENKTKRKALDCLAKGLSNNHVVTGCHVVMGDS